jgi:hypothetical protein
LLTEILQNPKHKEKRNNNNRKTSSTEVARSPKTRRFRKSKKITSFTEAAAARRLGEL